MCIYIYIYIYVYLPTQQPLLDQGVDPAPLGVGLPVLHVEEHLLDDAACEAQVHGAEALDAYPAHDVRARRELVGVRGEVDLHLFGGRQRGGPRLGSSRMWCLRTWCLIIIDVAKTNNRLYNIYSDETIIIKHHILKHHSLNSRSPFGPPARDCLRRRRPIIIIYV